MIIDLGKGGDDVGCLIGFDFQVVVLVDDFGDDVVDVVVFFIIQWNDVVQFRLWGDIVIGVGDLGVFSVVLWQEVQ